MPFLTNFAQGQGRIIDDEPMDAEIVSEVMNIKKLHQMTLFCGVVRDAVTAVVMRMECSPTGDPAGSDWKLIQNQAQTPPDKALVPQTWTVATISADIGWAFDVAENGALSGPFLRLRFTNTAGTADDKLTVDAYAEE